MRIPPDLANRALAAAAARMVPVYVVISGLYVLFRVGSFTNIADRVTDTPSYEQVAAHPLWSVDFYGGVRPFTLPLLYKVVTGSEGRIVAQLVISTLCWLVLAGAVARAVRHRVVRPVAFAAVLAFSLTTEVILWDTLLLSESLTFALTALLLAAWFGLLRRPTRAAAVLVVVLLLLWTFARDSNAYVVLALAVLLAFSLLEARQRRLKLALLVACASIFAAGFGSAEAGERWLQPMHDVVFRRVIPTPGLREYFAQHGLSTTVNWTVTPWLERARSIYVGYLLRHPSYTLAAPFHGRQQALYSTPGNLESLLDPDLRIYNDNASRRFLPLPGLLERVLFPRGLIAVLTLIGAAVALTAVVAAWARPETVWIVPAGLLLTTYPHLLVVWHFSGYEVDRHALEAALLLRLGVLLLLVFSVDRALVAVRAAIPLGALASRMPSSRPPWEA